MPFTRNPNPPEPQLPDWSAPTQDNNPSAGDINSISNTLSERILTVSPWGRYVPIVFGEDKIGGILTLVQVQAGFLYMRLVWCVGEIGSIESVTLEDGTVPTDTVFTHYTGTASQTADPTLVGLVPGYSDTLTDIGPDEYDLAYTVVKVPEASLTGFPRFIAHIKGLKMLSPVPKTQLTRLTTASETDSDILSYVGNVITITDNSDGTIGQFIRYEEDELINNDDYNFTIEVTAISDIGSGDILVQWCGNSLIDDNTSLQMNINALGTYNGTASFSSYTSANNFIRFDVTGANVGVSVTYEVTLYNATGNAVSSYSNIAGVALNHLFTNSQMGLGLTADLTSLVELINRNSSVLASGSFSESRSAIGLSLTKKAQVAKHIEVLRGYSRCNISNMGGVITYYPLMPRTASFSLTQSDVKPSSLKPDVKDARSIPNVVRVYYTDTFTTPWKDNYVEIETSEVTSGSEYRREAVYRMGGFQSRTAALRFGYDRINERLRKFSLSFKTHEAMYDKEEGETFNFTNPRLGSTNFKMKLLSKKKIGPSEWEVQSHQEDDAIYSNEIADYDPDAGTITLPDPFTMIEASGLSLSVETPQYQTSIYFTRLRVTWTATTYSYNHVYQVELYEDDTDLLLDTQQHDRNTLIAVFPNIQENITYRVELKVIGFATSAGISSTITPAGKNFPPTDVGSFNISSFQGLTTCSWKPAADNNEVWYYEIQFGPSGFTWNDINSRLVITRIDSYEYVTQYIPTGTWDFLIKAVDNAGNESTNATRFEDVEIEDQPDLFQMASGSIEIADSKTSDMSPFLSDRVNSLLAFDAGFYDIKDYATHTGNTWAELHPNAMNTYTTDPFLTTGVGVSGSALYTESIDAGQVIDGVWTIVNTVSEAEILGLYNISGGNMIEVLSGDPPILSIELSDDDTTWTAHTGQLNVHGTARYMRLSIVSQNQTDSWIYRHGTYNYIVNAKIKTEFASWTWTTSGEFFLFERHTSNIQFASISVAESTAYTPSYGWSTGGTLPTLYDGLHIKLTDTSGAWTTNDVDLNIVVRYV